LRLRQNQARLITALFLGHVFRPDSFAFHAVAASYSSIALRCVGVNHHFGGPAVRNTDRLAIVTKAPASRRAFCLGRLGFDAPGQRAPSSPLLPYPEGAGLPPTQRV